LSQYVYWDLFCLCCCGGCGVVLWVVLVLGGVDLFVYCLGLFVLLIVVVAIDTFLVSLVTSTFINPMPTPQNRLPLIIQVLSKLDRREIKFLISHTNNQYNLIPKYIWRVIIHYLNQFEHIQYRLLPASI